MPHSGQSIIGLDVVVAPELVRLVGSEGYDGGDGEPQADAARDPRD